jgi:UDP-glucose 4-epimerase
MLTVIEKSTQPLTVANLGTDEYCCVDDSLGWICAELGVQPRRVYTGGERGWVGDNPFIFLDTSFLRGFGWKPKLTIRQAVVKTLDYLKANRYVLRRRKAA